MIMTLDALIPRLVAVTSLQASNLGILLSFCASLHVRNPSRGAAHLCCLIHHSQLLKEDAHANRQKIRGVLCVSFSLRELRSTKIIPSLIICLRDNHLGSITWPFLSGKLVPDINGML